MTSRITASKRPAAEQPLRRQLAVAHNGDLVAFGFEVEAQAIGEMLFVFDDQNSWHARRSSTRAHGAAGVGLSRSGLYETRQLHRERRALAFAVAGGKHAAAVLLDDRAHDVEAEAGAFHFEPARLDAIEAIEDALAAARAECRRRDP